MGGAADTLVLASGFLSPLAPPISPKARSALEKHPSVTRRFAFGDKGDPLKRVPFSFPLHLPHHPQPGDREQKLSFGSVGVLEFPQPLCAISAPTVVPWQVQGALCPEHTVNPSTFPHLCCYHTGPNQSHLLPGLLIHLPPSTVAPLHPSI